MLLIITICTFVCISLGVMGLYWLVYRPQSAATERLRRLGEGSASVHVPSVSLVEERPAAEFAELVKAIRAGLTYANVHTSKFPGGEIRGQIKTSPHHEEHHD